MEDRRDRASIKLIKNLQQVSTNDLQEFIDCDIFTKDHLLQAVREHLLQLYDSPAEESSDWVNGCFCEAFQLVIEDLDQDDVQRVLKGDFIDFPDETVRYIFNKFSDEIAFPFEIVLVCGSDEQIRCALFSLTAEQLCGHYNYLLTYLRCKLTNDIDEDLSECDPYTNAPSDPIQVKKYIEGYLDDHVQEIIALKHSELCNLLWLIDKVEPSELFIDQFNDVLTDHEPGRALIRYIGSHEGKSSDTKHYESLVKYLIDKEHVDDIFSMRILSPTKKCRDEFITEKIRRVFPTWDLNTVNNIIQQIPGFEYMTLQSFALFNARRIQDFLDHFD